MSFKIIIVLMFAAITTGCNYFSNSGKSNENTKLQELEKSVAELENKMWMAEMRSEKYTSATFDPAEAHGYGRVDTSAGTVLISLEDAKPHLDGVKVKIKIGNIQSAVYSDFKLICEYGKRYPKYIKNQSEINQKNRLEFEASKRIKEEKFMQTLKAGWWNIIEIYLPDIKPNDFGYLEIKIELNTVMLIKK